MRGLRWLQAGWIILAAAGAGRPDAGRADDAAPHLLVVDATAAVPAPGPSAFAGGTCTAPDGRSITLNSRHLLRDGKPWLPVAGEFHYTRVPEGRWEEELLKMKAAGVQIVSTYVIWIHHEEVKGRFDWSGRRDLRGFVERCGRHGLLVQLRIGPWAHAEVRNGGFPDWLVQMLAPGQLRMNSPAYLSLVARYFDEIARQVKGLLWKDGGPVIGIQLENEYARQGPDAGEAHILALKDLALQAGLGVPLWFVTGWDNAVVPRGAVLPVYGGYMDAPWNASREQLPPSEVYLFRFASRVAGSMGMIRTGDETTPGSLPADADTPFLTAEMAGGVQVTYHRRPVIAADDVAAMVPVMLGSGVNLYGLYMFQGGGNPDGRLSTLQESQATGYPNDVPVKNYDFHAPLSAFGRERESFRRLKVFAYFLGAFGDRLAPLAVRPPEIQPRGPDDFSVPRFSVRTNGGEGFVFWSNYVRHYPMPTWTGVQVAIRLPHEVLTVPRRPITVPSGAYFIWPFNLDLDGARLKYSTAQLFTRLRSPEADTFVFAAIPGIDPEFAFDGATVLRAPGGRVVDEHGVRYVTGLEPGPAPAIVLETAGGAEVRIILLSELEAERAWSVAIDGRDHLLISAQQFFADRSHFVLQSIGDPEFEFQILPALAHGLTGNREIRPRGDRPGLSGFAATVPGQKLRVSATRVADAGPVGPVKLGPPAARRGNAVAQAPDDPAFAQAAKWRIAVPEGLPSDLGGILLEIRYVGDVARLTSNGRLLADDFFSGPPWEVGLDDFRREVRAGPLELDILPLRKDAPIFLEGRYRPGFPVGDQRAELQALTLIPVYQLSIDAGPR